MLVEKKEEQSIGFLLSTSQKVQDSCHSCKCVGVCVHVQVCLCVCLSLICVCVIKCVRYVHCRFLGVGVVLNHVSVPCKSSAL